MSVLRKCLKPSWLIGILYSLMVVITFQIAFSHSNIHGQEEFDRCMVVVGPADQASCDWYQPGVGNAFVAALTWPFYLTYRLLR